MHVIYCSCVNGSNLDQSLVILHRKDHLTSKRYSQDEHTHHTVHHIATNSSELEVPLLVYELPFLDVNGCCQRTASPPQ